jgi:hypothetical protein
LQFHIDALTLIDLERDAAYRRLAEARHLDAHVIDADLESGDFEETALARLDGPLLLSTGVKNGDGRGRYDGARFFCDSSENTGTPLREQRGGSDNEDGNEFFHVAFLVTICAIVTLLM